MTKQERVVAAIRGEKPDRVPICIVWDDGYIARAAGVPHWEFKYGGIEEQVAIQLRAWERHPQNDILRSWTGTNRGPLRRRFVRDGSREFLVNLDTGERQEIDPEGIPGVWDSPVKTSQLHGAGQEVRVRTTADIDALIPDPPDPYELLGTDSYVCLRKLVDAVGDEAFVAFNSSSILPATLGWLGGHIEGIIFLHQHPDLFAHALARQYEWHIAHMRAAAMAGGKIAWPTCFFEGADVLNPAVWRRLQIPNLKRFVAVARELDVLLFLWFLGDCLPLLQDIAGTGVDALVIEQPRTNYSSDPTEMRRIVGNDLCICGWNWELDMLHDDRPAITRTIEEQIRGAGADGAFIWGGPPLTVEYDPNTIHFVCDEVVRLGSYGQATCGPHCPLAGSLSNVPQRPRGGPANAHGLIPPRLL